jgi:hypothetical protein
MGCDSLRVQSCKYIIEYFGTSWLIVIGAAGLIGPRIRLFFFIIRREFLLCLPYWDILNKPKPVDNAGPWIVYPGLVVGLVLRDSQAPGTLLLRPEPPESPLQQQNINAHYPNVEGLLGECRRFIERMSKVSDRTSKVAYNRRQLLTEHRRSVATGDSCQRVRTIFECSR